MFRPYRPLNQDVSDCQVQSAGSASGQVLFDRLTNQVRDLALGLADRLFLGVLEDRSVEVTRVQLDPEPLPGPLGRELEVP